MNSISFDQECPAGRALRKALAENIPHRCRNGQFSPSVKIQRDLLHKALRAKIGIQHETVSLIEREIDPTLTADERTSLLEHYDEIAPRDNSGGVLYAEIGTKPDTSLLPPKHAFARAACFLVLAVGAVTAFAASDLCSAFIAAAPLGKLFTAALGRIV